jgi:hypothetical protein
MDAICKDCLVTKPLTEYYQIYRHCPIKVCKECYKTKQKIVYKQRYIKKEKTKSLRHKTVMMIKVDYDNIADFGMLSPSELKQMIQKIRDEMLSNKTIIKIIQDEIFLSEKNRNYKIL